MAYRNFAPLRALDRDAVFLFGGGTGAGAANLTSVLGAGVSSIAETATGKYTITFAAGLAFNAMLFFQGVVIDPTAVDDWEVVVESYSLTNRTISIVVFKGGAATDLTSDEKLKFMAVYSNTAQAPTSR